MVATPSLGPRRWVIDSNRDRAFYPQVRRYLIVALTAALGVVFGFAVLGPGPTYTVLGACSGGVSQVPGVAPKPCMPAATVIPSDGSVASFNVILGVLLALGLLALIWFAARSIAKAT